MLTDGLIFFDGNKKIIFNHRSFCELIKHLICHYTGISYEEASETVERSSLTELISNIKDAVLLAHEYPYYWAMTAFYGHAYWEKGIPAQPEDMTSYFEAESKIIRQYNLSEPFEFE